MTSVCIGQQVVQLCSPCQGMSWFYALHPEDSEKYLKMQIREPVVCSTLDNYLFHFFEAEQQQIRGILQRIIFNDMTVIWGEPRQIP